MHLNFFSIIVFLILLLSFLTNRDFPNGLFSLKELGVYVITVIASILIIISVAIPRNAKKTSFIVKSPLMLSAFLLMVVIPVTQTLTKQVVFSNVLLSVATFIIFYAIIFFSYGICCKELAKRFLLLIFSALVCQITLSGIQYFGISAPYHHLSKISGMFFNPGPFAIYLTSLFVVLLPLTYVEFKRNKSWISWLLIVPFIVFLFILLELGSRSAWIGLASSLVTMIGYLHIRFYKTRVVISTKSIILSTISLIALISIIGYWFYQIRPASANGRMLIWKSTLSMIKDNFWDGVGIGNFVRIYPKYQANQLQNPEMLKRYGILAGESEYAFNDTLHLFTELGVIGALLFIFIIFYSLIKLHHLVKNKNSADLEFVLICSLFASLMVLFVAGMTAYPLQMLPISLWFWAILAVVVTVTTASDSNNTIILSNYFIKKLTISILIIIVLGYGYFGINKLNGYIIWKENLGKSEFADKIKPYIWAMENEGKLYNDIGHFYFINQQTDQAILYFDKATLCAFNKEYYYDLGKAYEKLGRLSEAMIIYKFLEETIPYLIKPKYLQAEIQYSLGNYKKFIILAQEVVRMEPKVFNSSVELMKRKMRIMLNTIPPQ